MKIYSFNDVDYYAAKNLRDAVREYVRCSNESVRDALEGVRLLSENEMNTLVFVDDHYNDDDDLAQRSFREQLNIMIETGEHFPCGFASSEY